MFDIDFSSQAAYFIEPRFNAQPLAKGTGFFLERNNQLYFITNWHNVTGRNPLTGDYLSKHAAMPNNVDVHVFKNQQYLDWDILNIPLLDEDENPLWLEHPVFKHVVDVIAIKVDLPAELLVTRIDRTIEPLNEKTTVSIGNDVFILGFPFGISAGQLPIWKRASIASEPFIDIDGVPKLLVDTASRPGMSGSPVIYKERRQMSLKQGDYFSRYLMKFVGIYSGRIGSDELLQAQLGVVWKASVIEEIINQPSATN